MTTATIPTEIQIGERTYRLERLDPDPRVARVAWRLHYWRTIKKTGQLEHVVYDVHQDEFSVHCDCPDATFRHEYAGESCCKHVAKLIELGFL